MSCGCNSGTGCRKGVLATKQTGDTVPIALVLKDGDLLSVLMAGQEIVLGIWDRKKQLVVEGSTCDGRIEYSEGAYRITVTHEESLKMKGKVYVEITVTDGAGVHHGDKVVALGFEQRNNNEILNDDGTVRNT